MFSFMQSDFKSTQQLTAVRMRIFARYFLGRYSDIRVKLQGKAKTFQDCLKRQNLSCSPRGPSGDGKANQTSEDNDPAEGGTEGGEQAEVGDHCHDQSEDL